jgi:hypothetical protein
MNSWGLFMFYSFNLSYFFKMPYWDRDTGNTSQYFIDSAIFSHEFHTLLEEFWTSLNLWFFAAILAQVSESIGRLGELGRCCATRQTTKSWSILHGSARQCLTDVAVCQNLVPLVNIKIAGKWMFIPLKMYL